MEIIETPIFTQQIRSLLSDEEYRDLQNALIKSPDLGKVIQGSGGLRKMRWSQSGTGKSGGIRAIYYWYVSPEIVLMLYAYPKGKQETLSPKELKALKALLEGE